MSEEKRPLLASGGTDSSVRYSVSGREHTVVYTDSNYRGPDESARNQYRYEARHSMVDSLETVTLSWENINLYTRKGSKQILRNVYGHVKPGTLLAIIGASGSGKTTLLNTLTSRIDSSTLSYSGDIRVNGTTVGTGIRNISAYVQQDDLFIATMTVKEHLTFRALLRMDKSVNTKRRLERVDEVLKELGLQKCEDNMIGNPGRIKGISGGEMRRLSFASEILTNPPLLFCDEATSGLDSFMADNIVQTLKGMADKGKTVLCTIHQPSSDVFSLFHNVLVMAEGRVAFMGEAEEALRFYERVGFNCPKNYNPADFYILTMAVVPGKESECKRRIETICDSFEATDQAKQILNDNKFETDNAKHSGVIFDEATSHSSRYEATWTQQFKAVFKRSLKTVIREPMVTRVRIAQTVVIAVVLGLIYLRLELSQTGVQDINGVLFLLLMNMTFSNVFGVLNSFPLETPIFFREYATGLYGADVYFLCKSFAELPTFIVIPLVFCAITYWMVGLYSTFMAFLVFTGILVLVANISVSFGYIVSTSANSVTTALAIAPPLMIPLIMFGGFFLNKDSVPVYFIWLEYLSWFKYSNEMIAINQWENVDSIPCANRNTSATPGVTQKQSNKCLFDNGEDVIDYLNFDKDNIWTDLYVLISMMIAYRIIAFLILLIKARLSVRHKTAQSDDHKNDTPT
ncbi:protein white-like [Ruditapes philippinarum]|uniref:protein white-like n=1 Tax=Ruditapes philippinarum TaxID=129788 RepID=UPI00295A85B3|nr:protein white-like [Ruditapes philippinarum]